MSRIADVPNIYSAMMVIIMLILYVSNIYIYGGHIVEFTKIIMFYILVLGIFILLCVYFQIAYSETRYERLFLIKLQLMIASGMILGLAVPNVDKLHIALVGTSISYAGIILYSVSISILLTLLMILAMNALDSVVIRAHSQEMLAKFLSFNKESLDDPFTKTKRDLIKYCLIIIVVFSAICLREFYKNPTALAMIILCMTFPVCGFLVSMNIFLSKLQAIFPSEGSRSA